MLTGKVPFGGEGYGEIIVKHITAAVPSPRAINPLLPTAIESIILRALAKAREDRFQTMEEFASALLDPERYAASAPALAQHIPPVVATALVEGQGASPNGRADSVASGQVLFGSAEQDLGARPAPLPSTFRHAAGELLDDLDSPPRRRRTGLVVAIVGAMAVAGLAVFFFTHHDPPLPSTPPPTAAAMRPAVFKKVRLSFKSDPEGAAVLRKDTGEQLGTTPFAIEIPASQASIGFLFKKDRFEDKTESLVPSVSAQLAVALKAMPQTTPAAPAPVLDVQKEVQPAARTTRKRRPATIRKHVGHTMDEDGVLAPSF